jgi:hypothetical protein
MILERDMGPSPGCARYTLQNCGTPRFTVHRTEPGAWWRLAYIGWRLAYSGADARNRLDLCKVIASTCGSLKTKRKQRRSINSVSTPRWTAYMAAAAASAVAGAGSAEAEIHYSGVRDIKFSRTSQDELHKLPLSGGAFLGFGRFIGGSYYVAGVAGVAGAAISNAVRSGFFLARLDSGVSVSSGRFYDLGELGELFGIYNSGAFAPSGEGFVGFRFNNGQGMQYGWARLEMGKYPKHNFKVVDYAWGEPGESIRTGQTTSGGDRVGVVPDQGSLGLLALGAAGLMGWRRRRREF